MDEDDHTVGDRFRSRDIGKGSGDFKSTIRDIIDADRVLLETDPEAIFFPSTQKYDCAPRFSVSKVLLTCHPTYWRPWCWKNLTHYCAIGRNAIWLFLLSGMVEAEIGRVMASGDCTKQLEADDTLM